MAEKTKSAESATVTQRVDKVVNTLRPLIQADGGDIELVNVDEGTGVVSIRFRGACVGCPSAAITLQMGVERHVKEKVPEVSKVIAVN
jgi:Fe-S cluster biogenesis protein NfuA